MNNIKDNINENNGENLFIENSDENSDDIDVDNKNVIFISSDSSKEDLTKSKEKLFIKQKNKTILNATTGADIITNINKTKQNIECVNTNSFDCDNIDMSVFSHKPMPNTGETKSTSSTNSAVSVQKIINSKPDNINGWDKDASITIKNWYKTFRQQSFIYQWILDRNRKMSDRLNILSIVSSSSLGIFSAFKLWLGNELVFQTTSDIILMLSNFIVAILTATSKRYIDDKRNEQIRSYIEEIDIFIGEISAQILKSSTYRMNADDFFKQNNDKYTKLITIAPNITIIELTEGKKQFQAFDSIIRDESHNHV
jgi:hypothetical protein